MAISAEWLDDECTILHQRYDGKWNWQDFYASFKHEVMPMMSSVPHTVHLLADVSTSASIPAGNLFHTRNVLNQLPPNWGLAIALWGCWCKSLRASIPAGWATKWKSLLRWTKFIKSPLSICRCRKSVFLPFIMKNRRFEFQQERPVFVIIMRF
jgi:hypothetical protein